MARILVVDDQKISRLTLAGILGEAGHRVRAEASGPGGIAAARSWLPDVVVLDVHMPEMDGFEVVARLKQDPVTESIPVVFLTGEHPTDELIVRGLDLGAYDFLSKGCSKGELLARVGVMERIKRGHDELAAIARVADALLQTVDPEELGRDFVREATHVFRAGAVLLRVERQGVRRSAAGGALEGADDSARSLALDHAGRFLGNESAAVARVLAPPDARAMTGPLGTTFGSAVVARVRRGPSTVVVLVLAEDLGAYREEVDAPLLRTLSSQVAIALEHALLTERARIQARDLERAMGERSRFFASLSHELRTPINAVIGYNHLLQEKVFGPLNEKQADAVAKANRSARHLMDLVDDILDISKIEAGKMEIFPEPVELVDLLMDTTTSLQLQAREKGLHLRLHAPDSVPITTDPGRLRQVVLNLLSNAVKFTADGGIDVRVEDQQEGGVVIRVADTGPGISAEDRERIFEEFEQGASGGAGTGTGLGLAIARRLARLLGGGLDVDSEVGSGSTFILALPSETPVTESDAVESPAAWGQAG
jgi:signal transduction histidine kinase